MTAAMPEYKDAIGQDIKGGDIVISVRDGTGANPRMAVKFTPAKVQVSGWGNNVSSMDACSLVVITPNVEKLIADGDQDMAAKIADLRTRYDAMVEQPKAIKAGNPPIRWIVHSYYHKSDAAKIVYISMHRLVGTSDEEEDRVESERQALMKNNELQWQATMSKNPGFVYSQQPNKHWDGYHTAHKDCLHSRKAIIEVGIDGFDDNTLIPVAQFNNVAPATHRIHNV